MGSYTSTKDEEFFGAIGRLTISWASLEAALEWWSELMWSSGGHRLESEQPRSLQRKVNFLRAVMEQMPLPPESHAGYKSFFDTLDQEIQTRHDILHGAIVQHVERSGEAMMVRPHRRKLGFTQRRYKVTTRHILQAAVRVNRLAGKVFRSAEQLQEVVNALLKQHAERTPS